MKEDLGELRGCRVLCRLLQFKFYDAWSALWGGHYLSHLLTMLLSCHTQITSVPFALMQATPGLILCDHPRGALVEGFDLRRLAAHCSSRSTLTSCQARFHCSHSEKVTEMRTKRSVQQVSNEQNKSQNPCDIAEEIKIPLNPD